ncbi:MAG: MBL fold metallo-hydrolase [Candidatus Omnitrophica bacterium]|nr:MBL fold metallo-hydrolase [Candidatus Omnitrophota bacterium]
MILETLCLGSMQVNCYVLASEAGGQAIIIDPGAEEDKIKRILMRHKLKPAFIINTHGHIDHIGCDDEFGVPVYVHRQDAPMLKDPGVNLSAFLISPFSVKSKINPLEDKEKIELGKISLEVIHIPGHTPGGICLLMHKPSNKILFTGDSLFFQGIGRTDFPGADEGILIESIKEKLFKLSDDTVIYPGHGPSSTIGEEKKNNPFLR